MTASVKLCGLLLALGVLLGAATAQNPASAQDAKLITRVKSTLVSQLEAGMPRISLEYFLKSEAGSNAELTWEVNDCGEQTGNPAAQSGGDVPTCVEANATLADGRVVSVAVAVGSARMGTEAVPRLFSVFVNGARKPISRLAKFRRSCIATFPGGPNLATCPGFLPVAGMW